MNLRIDEHNRNDILISELKEYEAITIMTSEERAALHDWVADGNSVYENNSFYSQENGQPMSFLHAYRYNQEVLEIIKKGGENNE